MRLAVFVVEVKLALLALVALTWMTGCATSAPEQDGGGFGFWAERDDFQLLQQSAGVEEDSWHEVGSPLQAGDAQALWEALARTRTTHQNFGPRRSLIFVLRQLRTQDEDVPYAELLQRLRPFRSLVVMRPDGYLVSALTGRALQRMGGGRVSLRDGRLMVGQFEVGAFYRDKYGVFYTVDDSLRQPGTMVGELGLERDWFNAALDGSEDALGELAQALAELVTHPIRSLEGLQQLPAAVAALIASSPEYFARYGVLPLQEQIREAARLSTHLMMLYGSAAGGATRVGSAGVKLPVLSLSAEGTLAIEQVVLPAGTTAAALGTGAGAVYVLAQPSSASKGAGTGFKSFTENNFRENLSRLTGQLPSDAHAHHVFPQKFARTFSELGIDIHDPRYGAWWARSGHLKKAAEYTSKWEEFLVRARTREEILQYGRDLGVEYGFKVNF
ncbi:MAG TPA: hypothetical protein VF815_43850 [Myxococcaceae bacterium]|jgi:hypothetical protein